MPDNPPVSEIISLFEDAVHQLLQNDDYLLVHKVSERNITHKLGEYLQPLFRKWNVDCEYNRNGDGPKRVQLLGVDLPRDTFLDVVVHERGTNNHNLLIIEAKKYPCNPADENLDRRKLEAYVDSEFNHFNYSVGIFVNFHIGSNPAKKYHFEYYHDHTWHNEAGEPISQ